MKKYTFFFLDGSKCTLSGRTSGEAFFNGGFIRLSDWNELEDSERDRIKDLYKPVSLDFYVVGTPKEKDFSFNEGRWIGDPKSMQSMIIHQELYYKDE